MNVSEFCPLTKEAVDELLGLHPKVPSAGAKNCRRRAARWPFPATVEMWVPDENGVEQHVLGTCLNISRQGIGLRSDEPLKTGMELSVSLHQPEVSLFGRMVVRHSTGISRGWYVGLEFLFEKTGVPPNGMRAQSSRRK